LADIDFVIALIYQNHPHSKIAISRLAGFRVPKSIAVCRVVEMGVLRLLTNRSVMGGEVLSASDAWTHIDRLLADYRFIYADEPQDLEARWRHVRQTISTGSLAGTDAYLAAFALAADLSIVSFDKGMARFEGLKAVVPSKHSGLARRE
jgi:toxin-antitoxin system PIN domain toxin